MFVPMNSLILINPLPVDCVGYIVNPLMTSLMDMLLEICQDDRKRCRLGQTWIKLSSTKHPSWFSKGWTGTSGWSTTAWGWSNNLRQNYFRTPESRIGWPKLSAGRPPLNNGIIQHSRHWGWPWPMKTNFGHFRACFMTDWQCIS